MSVDTVALDALVEAALTAKAHPLPRLCAVVAGRDRVLWSAARGAQTYHDDTTTSGQVRLDTPFAMFSQSKLVTCLCGLQLLERGEVSLTDEVCKYVPELKNARILKEYTPEGEEVWEDLERQPMIKDLFTHTGGFVYTPMHPAHEQFRLKHGIEKQVEGLNGDKEAITHIPLGYQPGTNVVYGTGIDYIGYVVEAVSGLELDAYTQKYILDPLDINDTVYRRTPEYLSRQVNLVTPVVTAGKTTAFKPATTNLPINPKSCAGGGGLHSSAQSFIKILQALLNDGVYAETGARILSKESVDMLCTAQITEAEPKLKKIVDDWLRYDQDPFHRSSPEDKEAHELVPRRERTWGMGSPINVERLPNARHEGTLSGSGFADTYWWVDRKAGICCTFMINTAPGRAPGVHDFWAKLETEIYKHS